jgi:RNA polymerase sigma-70 factor (ECF subfamily)
MFFFQKEGDEQFDFPDENAQTDYSGEREMVQQAIQKLEPKFRSVIVLRLIDGYSTEETSKILNIPPGTVLSRLARGQQKLKKLLLPYMGEIR